MEAEGNIRKMRVVHEKIIDYYLPVGDREIYMNDLVGKEICLTWLDRINCIHCGRVTGKSFAQGYCYPCFIKLPETDECILRPERCKAHLGISRDQKWAEEYCLQDHFVYLSLTSGLKVGVTRMSQVPVRWIDQGAIKAIKLARAPDRYTAGIIEVELKEHFNDKTNWRHMLTNNIVREIDLVIEKNKAATKISGGNCEYITDDSTVCELSYPVNIYPEKVRSTGFDKTVKIQGVLTGIKGQYLMFEQGDVINIRKHNGYLVRIEQ